ncbi:hypothetical protein EW146_g2297 [Bondarzewia mesenterica]|uniref:Alpha/beta hydrolase fold-3 domain-containing protein n=1 Tax=Bondarzewia mesenterica TaxID=1095465 RepID=A0A4S4M128_9AGAM|nr:hypothetical protein EW146_g2297 [Bondarzewia mesenterica]
MTDRGSLGVECPEFAALTESEKSLVIPTDPTAARELFKNRYAVGVEAHFGPTLPADSSYRIEDHHIPVEGDENIFIRCLIPTCTSSSGQGQTFPLLVWYHGGAWISGFALMDDYILRHICVELQVVIINVDYRLAPEYTFPIGVNDCYAGLKWAASNDALLSADLSKGFIVSGFSAGGSLAAVMALRARDDPFFKARPLTGQILHSPLTIHPDAYKSSLKSVEEFWEGPVLFGKSFRSYCELTKAVPTDTNFSPLLATTHAGLPPLCMQVAGMDPLRDEDILYEQALRAAGVKTKLHVYPGVPHAFQWIFPTLSVSRQFEKDFRDGIRWILEMSASSKPSSRP